MKVNSSKQFADRDGRKGYGEGTKRGGRGKKGKRRGGSKGGEGRKGMGGRKREEEGRKGSGKEKGRKTPPVSLLHTKVRLPVPLCAVKTVEGDFRFCWTITQNVGQAHKENPNLVRILYMVCTLNDIYKQYNKLHEHWYTKISSLRCVADRNPHQNASDLYTKYWSYAEHCRPCTRLSGVN